jgi:hypothetical protein
VSEAKEAINRFGIHFGIHEVAARGEVATTCTPQSSYRVRRVAISAFRQWNPNERAVLAVLGDVKLELDALNAGDGDEARRLHYERLIEELRAELPQRKAIGNLGDFTLLALEIGGRSQLSGAIAGRHLMDPYAAFAATARPNEPITARWRSELDVPCEMVGTWLGDVT